jgi:hypothetical protein
MIGAVTCGMPLSGAIFASCTAARNRSVGAIERSHLPSRLQGSQQIHSFVTAQFRQTNVVLSIGAMVAAPDSVIEQKSTTKGLR